MLINSGGVVTIYCSLGDAQVITALMHFSVKPEGS